MTFYKDLLAHFCLTFLPSQAGGGKVLMFHKVLPDIGQTLNRACSIQTADFEQKLLFLKENNFQFLSMDKFLQAKAANHPGFSRSLLVTFDDGAWNNYLHAYPILKKLGIPALFFLSTDYIGSFRVFWWDHLERILLASVRPKIWFECNNIQRELGLRTFEEKRKAYAFIETCWRFYAQDHQLKGFLENLQEKLGIGNLALERSAMDWDEVKHMHAAGFDFGSHTLNHVWLTRLPLEAARKEILSSAQAIQQQLGAAVKSFAYPYGDFNAEHRDFLRSAGFTSAFTVNHGSVLPGDDPLTLRRIGVGAEGPLVFKAKLASAYPEVAARLGQLIKR